MQIPRAPESLDLEELPQTCRALLRSPKSAEERQVARAGWQLFNPVVDSRLAARGSVIVAAASNFDGMCRPDGYQDFVFVDGKFAGTLSPNAMGARSDGSSVVIKWIGPRTIAVEFSRYEDKDPLCCPSRISAADFEVQQVNGKFVVAVKRIQTRPAQIR